MWSLDVTERVHQMREAASKAFQSVPWLMSAQMPPLKLDDDGCYRTPEAYPLDGHLLRMRGRMAYLMPGVGVE